MIDARRARRTVRGSREELKAVFNMASDNRLKDLIEFYAILGMLETKIGGARKLTECSGRILWPRRGVYFFQEPGEQRLDSGEGPRIVRIGTHALRKGGRARLWTRLSQHKGQKTTGGGNHRGSVFRLIVGSALIQRHAYSYPNWGDKSITGREVRTSEQLLEREVSNVIGSMPFLWLAIDDEAGPESLRGYIEKNSIALLSNYRKHALDLPSQGWLGHYCGRERVSGAGLWNSDHADKDYDPASSVIFIGSFRRLAARYDCSHPMRQNGTTRVASSRLRDPVSFVS